MTPQDATDRDLELDRQAEIACREFFERVLLSGLAYGLCLIYLHPVWAVGLALTNLAAEVLSYRIARDPVRRRSDQGRRITLACLVVMEAAFAGAAGLIWLADDPFAQAFAVGMVMSTLLHLTTVRSIHLPYGLAGLASVTLTATLFNCATWLKQDNVIGLALSTVCLLGALSYTLTAMLSNNGVHREMRQEQARASRADAAKSRFLAVLSHEMRTPLNAVMGLAHRAEAEAETHFPEDPGHKDRMGLLVRSARDMAAILGDATDMSAIADGRFSLRERPVDLVRELETTVAPFRTQAERQGSDLEFQAVAPFARHVRLDPQRLRQCLSNLLTNALKHAGSGHVKIQAETTAGLIEVTVTDSGPGIPPQDRTLIFEPFHRGRAESAGAGLGLTIARALARQMGGDIRLLASARGASFRLSLPCHIVPASAVGAAPSTTMPDLRGRTVLIVDDTATNRLVATMQLRPSGARVLEAESGARALDLLAEEIVDMVLLDLNMPGMDGLETLSRLRALGGRCAGIPVVAMTADDTAARARNLPDVPGMNGVLIKPVEIDRLAAELNRHFPV